MSKRDSDPQADDGILAEDVTQLMEHIELTGERRAIAGSEWELATPAEDLEDAPILVGDDAERIPDLEAMEVGEDLEVIEDIELFTDTEFDLNRRLLQVEDEQLELAANLTSERARWQKRLESLRADLAERNRLVAARDQEIEDLSARLASLALERDALVDELQEFRRSAGQADAAAGMRTSSPPAGGIIESLHERLRERGRALQVAREEIDRLRVEREQLVASLAERGEFIQRLHARLRALERGEQGEGDLRKLLRRFFGGEQRVAEPPVSPPAAPELRIDAPVREVLIEDLQQSQLPAIAPRSELRLRRYLIGLDMVGSVYEITQGRVNVGRTRDNELRIVDPTVSRLHAMLKVRGRNVTVIDANSRNGVFVNGIQLRYATLEDGDTVAFGAVRFRYRVGSGASVGDFGQA